jgi:hypothetical protein
MVQEHLVLQTIVVDLRIGQDSSRFDRGVKSAGYNQPISGNRVPTCNQQAGQPLWY